MAFVNILAQSDSSINWDNLLNEYSYLDLSHVEIFPIPKELGFDQDCVGINVHDGYLSKEIVMSELTQATDFFINYKLKLFELYYGVEINQDNFTAVIDKLLPERRTL